MRNFCLLNILKTGYTLGKDICDTCNLQRISMKIVHAEFLRFKKKKENKHNRKWINDMNMGFTEKETYVIRKRAEVFSLSSYKGKIRQ